MIKFYAKIQKNFLSQKISSVFLPFCNLFVFSYLKDITPYLYIITEELNLCMKAEGLRTQYVSRLFLPQSSHLWSLSDAYLEASVSGISTF